jgi:hypothetical protein
MKTIKLSAALIAVVLGLTAAFAFKSEAPKKNGKFTVAWFQYNGPDPSKPTSYSILPSEPDCGGTGPLCAIEGNENGTTGEPTQASVNAPIATVKYDASR